jgi:hypothetical protein
MIVYRGTPRPESRPAKRDFAGVFFSEKPEFAAQYGSYLAKYEIPDQRLLNVESKDARRIAFLHHGDSEDYEEESTMDTFMFPDERWVKILKMYDYTGTRIGVDIFIYDLTGLKLLQTGVVLPSKS